MKKYEKYKESKISWIKEIPTSWTDGKIKYLCQAIYTGATPSTSEESYWGGDIPWLPSGVCHDCYVDKASKFITEAGYKNSSTKMIPANSTIIAITGATCGQLGYLTFPACANQSVVAFVEDKDKADSKYLYYYLFAARPEILTHKSGGAQGGINLNDCQNIGMPIPSLSEQQKIVAYLDYKTGKIDRLVEMLRERVDDLKKYRQSVITETVTRGLKKDAVLKDSGVDWIGQIPEGWKVVPLKHLIDGQMKYGANESAESENRDWPRYIRITDIAENGELRDESFKSLSPEKADGYMLQPGDILFARSGATVGKTYLFKENFPACYAGYLIKATCGKDLLPEFLIRYTQSHSYESWKSSVYILSTIQNIGADKYSNLPIPLPTISEQQAIAEYLDRKTKEIDACVAATEARIQDLQKYRSSLISEAVTGQIDVR